MLKISARSRLKLDAAILLQAGIGVLPQPARVSISYVLTYDTLDSASSLPTIASKRMSYYFQYLYFETLRRRAVPTK